MHNLAHRQNSLAFRTFTFDERGEVLCTHDITGRRQPAYSIEKRKYSNRARVARISGENWNPRVRDIGWFRVHTLSSKIDIELHGHASQIQRGGKWRSKYAFEWPSLVDLQWMERPSGKSLHLIDEEGRTLARCISKQAYGGEQMGKIEILVPGDDEFVDMCVVTSLAKWQDQDVVMRAPL